jgi:LysR family glycine cleavage system transcriptional activator
MRPKDLLAYPLLSIDWGADHLSPPTWRDWFAEFGISDVEVPCDFTCSLSSAALDAALDGRGLALAQHSLVSTALAAGTLLRLSDHCLPLPQPYFLAWNGTALDRPQSAAFHSWLINEAKRFERPFNSPAKRII